MMYGIDGQYLMTLRIVKKAISLGVYSVLLFVFLSAFSRILASGRMSGKAAGQVPR